MRKNICILLLGLLAGNLFAQVIENKSIISQAQELKELRTEVRTNLIQNILPFWSGKMPDEKNGGFYGRIDGNDKLYPDAYKGGILNARISPNSRIFHIFGSKLNMFWEEDLPTSCS